MRNDLQVAKSILLVALRGETREAEPGSVCKMHSVLEIKRVILNGLLKDSFWGGWMRKGAKSGKFSSEKLQAIAKGANDFERERKQQRERLGALNNDLQFVLQTEAMKEQLTEIRRKFPASFQAFFKHFTHLAMASGTKAYKYLDELPDPERKETRKVFKSYMQYVARFQVLLKPTRNGRFKLSSFIWTSAIHHALLMKGSLKPVDFVPGEETVVNNWYEADVEVPETLKPLIANGQARYLRIDDVSGNSALHDMERVYDPNCLTIVVHHSYQPFIICVVGERMPVDATWKAAGKVISELQLDLYNRQKVGRPANIARIRKAIKVRKQKGALQSNAHLLSSIRTEQQMSTNQSFLSRVGKKTKQAAQSLIRSVSE